MFLAEPPHGHVPPAAGPGQALGERFGLGLRIEPQELEFRNGLRQEGWLSESDRVLALLRYRGVLLAVARLVELLHSQVRV